MVRWVIWHCSPDTWFEIRALAVWDRARYLSVTEAPHNTEFYEWMGKKPFCFFQTAENGKRTPNSGVKGSGANHYPRAPAMKTYEPTLQFAPPPPVTGPVYSCAISTYSLAAILAHWTHRTHCHLCPTRYSYSPESSEAFVGEVPWTRTHTSKQWPNIEKGYTWYFSENLPRAEFEPARQAAAIAKHHSPTITQRLSLCIPLNHGRN